MIYHAATPEEWDDAAPHHTPGDFAADGFVHCSSADQLEASVNRFLGHRDSVVVLWLDPEDLGDDLRWEPGSLGEPQLFPHLHAPIAREQVRRADVWSRSADGSYRVSDLPTPLAP